MLFLDFLSHKLKCATDNHLNMTAAGRHVTHQTWRRTRHGPRHVPCATCASHMQRTRAEFIIKSCTVLVLRVTIKRRPVLNIPACERERASARSIVLPGTVQRGRSETGNATDPRKTV